MKILFIHPNFPGQYKFLARELAKDPDNQVVFLCNPKPLAMDGVRKIEIRILEKTNPQAHPYLQDFEKAIARGQAVRQACEALKKQGFTPDTPRKNTRRKIRAFMAFSFQASCWREF